MNTFSMAFVLQGRGSSPVGPVVTIVCYSEDPYDKKEVQRMAIEFFQRAMQEHPNMDLVFRDVVDRIRSECGVQAVMVNADCATVIAFK